MPTNPSAAADLTIRGPVEVAASVPYLLGFIPEASIVLVFFDDNRHLVLTGRVDLSTDPAECEQLVARCRMAARSASAAGATGVQVVAYLGEIGADLSPLLRELDLAFAAQRVTVVASGVVVADDWYDLTEPLTEPINLSEAGLDVVCSWIAQEKSYHSDRSKLRSQIVGEPTLDSSSVSSWLDDASPSAIKAPTRTALLRRETEDQIYTWLIESSVSSNRNSESRLPPSDVFARWLIALADRRVREPLLWRLANGAGSRAATGSHGETIGISDLAIDRLAVLTRNAPLQLAAPVSSVLAAVSWQLGNGALALIAAEYALDCDSTNILADLVRRAVGSGTPPSVWRHLLTSMTSAELRSGRPSARTRCA